MKRAVKTATKSRHNRRKVKCSVCEKSACFDSFNKHVKSCHSGLTNVTPLEISTPSVADFFRWSASGESLIDLSNLSFDL